MLNRRSFLATLASLPLVGKLFARDPGDIYTEAMRKTRKRDVETVNHIQDVFCAPDTCPLCEKPMDTFGDIDWGQTNALKGIHHYEFCHHRCLSSGKFIESPKHYLSQLQRRREMEEDVRGNAFLRKPTSGIHLTLQNEAFARASDKVNRLDAMIHRVEALL